MFFSKKDDKAQGSKPKGSVPVAVNYFVAKPSAFSNNIFTTGKIGAFNQIDIVPEIAGKITNIYFKEGETVGKGTLLVKLNDADLQAQLLKTKTQLKLAEQKSGRLSKLFDIKGVSQEEVDVQNNEVLALKSDEAFISAQIAKTNITAPFSGVIGLKNSSEGSFVNNANPIVSLVQLKPLYVEFSIPEKYSDLLKREMKIDFSTDNKGVSETYTASVYAIEPRVDETTKTIKARAQYTGSRDLFPGSFVKVYVNLGEVNNAIMVPTQCVIPTLKGQKVFVVKNGVACEEQVKIGLRTDEKLQILEGVAAGDTLVTTGLMSVKKGSGLKLLKSQH